MWNSTFLKMYYRIKPFIPRRVQIFLRRSLVLRKRRLCEDIWPIDKKAGRAPEGWPGWPEKKQFALVLTHDVEAAGGQKKCRDLMNLEMNLGFRSSFNFVPADYPDDPELRRDLVNNGFEVGVHGFTHDGSLYKSRGIFQYQALRINQFLKDWDAVGFRSPAMHHNLDWLGELDIEYDLSTFDTDPFEPQPDGMGTIFPFRVAGNSSRKGYTEMPYTLVQDFTLFILMRERTTDLWKQKLDWIAEQGGMALLNTHPDYMSFYGKKPGLEEYPAECYVKFLDYVRTRYESAYWHVVPRTAARFCAEFTRQPGG